jgi:hypothetical protein
LNGVRNSLKHTGILPNTKQWGLVGRETFAKLSDICSTCLGLTLDEIDESALLNNDEVRAHILFARTAMENQQYKDALEEVGKALSVLLDANTSLWDIRVGEAKAEFAIKLSSFGVPANDFLRLQEFLPQVSRLGEGPFSITWKQSEFGHPGNWNENAARFCLESFLQIAPRIQDAKWIPGAVELWYFYDYRVTAKEDNVEIWEEVQSKRILLHEPLTTKRKIGQLQKGESRTFSAIHQPLVVDWHDQVENEFFRIVKLHDDSSYSALFPGPMKFVFLDKVSIDCVPKNWRLEEFPDLQEIPWKSDDESIEEGP